MSFISLDKPVPEFRTLAIDPPRPALSQRFLLVKRAFDLGLAILLLPFVAMTCLVALVLNPFFNPGPLLFWQTRIGRNEKPFRICKLRTMTGANDAALFASDESHRITRLGAFLRAKRIDELPQVWNVLLGQMSFIGPRPEQPKFYEEFAQTIHQYNLRQVVKPGISGLAQVKSGYADDQDSTRAKLRYDLHYIRNMNAGMDAYIIARTFRVLITGFGAK